jgi:hypothetical protein
VLGGWSSDLNLYPKSFLYPGFMLIPEIPVDLPNTWGCLQKKATGLLALQLQIK